MATSRKHSGWSERVGMRRERAPVQALRDVWLFVRDLVTVAGLSLSLYLVLHMLVAVVRG